MQVQLKIVLGHNLMLSFYVLIISWSVSYSVS